MATVEHHLISRIIRTGELKEVLGAGITAGDFATHECRQIFVTLVHYYQDSETRGAVVGPQQFQSQYPQFEFIDEPGMTTAALCHEVRQARLGREVEQAAEHAHDLAQSDPLEAAKLMRQAADSITAAALNQGNDVFLSRRIHQMLIDYAVRADHGIPARILWPWQLLNDVTGGLNEEDYVLFYGRPKSMKTFVLTYMMAMAYENGGRILCYTKEMTPDNMLLRVAAFLGRLPYQETRLGTLTKEEVSSLYDLEKFIRTQAEDTHGQNDLIILSGRDARGGDGVMWLQSKVETYKPDACFVDGLYLMRDDRSTKRTADWQRVTNISRDVRQMILDTGVPVIATMQANRKAAAHQAAELDEVAYADAVGQDITHAFRVINEKTGPTIALVTAGAREYALHGLRINAVPCITFSFVSELTEKDISDAKEKDVSSSDAQEHAKPRKTPRIRVKGEGDKKAKKAKNPRPDPIEEQFKNLKKPR